MTQLTKTKRTRARRGARAPKNSLPDQSAASALNRLGPLLPRGAALFPSGGMIDHAAIEAELRERLAEVSARAEFDPSSNPVIALSLHLNRLIDEGALTYPAIEQLIQRLTVSAFIGRAEHAKAYLGEIDIEANEARIAELTRRIAADGQLAFAAFRDRIEAVAFGIVFTAHPTFSISQDLSRLLAQLMTGQDLAGIPLDEAGLASIIGEAAAAEHRPPADLTLTLEHRWSLEALENAHVALDRMNRAVLETARALYPDEWTKLSPRLLTIASWVGYDLDGRADITWRDTIGKRLVVKVAQLRRWENAVAAMSMAGRERSTVPLERLRLRLVRAREAVELQQATLAALGPDSPAKQVAAFARLMVEQAPVALTDTAELRGLLDQTLEKSEDGPLQLSVLVLRAEMAAHGLGVAHTHVRLNSTQIHNSIRSHIDLVTSPADPTHRRSYVSAINELLGNVEQQEISYASILSEDASARRLFMTIAQMVKHIDAETPVRFLIAETESGFTLLAALYFAKLFGVEDHVEISPLFETADALNHGELVVDEALKSPHFRAYVERLGRLTIQFGFSDSGRYLGQMGATFLIERLRLRLAATLQRHGLTGVQLVLFNTHGESIGRGAHPVSMADRFRYVAPPATTAEFRRLGIRVKEEVSFQGGDGYLWFMHPASALAVLRTALEDRFAPDTEEADDPIYARGDYAAEFFNTVEQFFERVVDNPDYAALLGVFGVNQTERTGSRPVKRQSEGSAGPIELTHHSQLRAIPNNSLLQQLGLLGNVIGGLGLASAKDPESFAELYRTSPRFRRAIEMVEYAASLSDPQALHAYFAGLDPAFWLDRAAQASRGDTVPPDDFRALAWRTETFGRHDRLMRIYRVFYSDYLLLQDSLRGRGSGGSPASGLSEERRATLTILHSVRVTLMQRLWLLATHIPEFSPQLGTSVGELVIRIIQLDVESAVARLREIFPSVNADEASGEDFGEAATYFADSQRTYQREHRNIFDPMSRIFGLIRRVGAAVTYHAGAVG